MFFKKGIIKMDNIFYIEIRFLLRWIIYVYFIEKFWFFFIYVEILLFYVLNVKVIFGNIGGGEFFVVGVYVIKVDI